MHELNGAVRDLLVRVAETVVMPRFKNLVADEVSEKSPGEIVTIADHEAEELLDEGLQQLTDDARIVGEEAVAVDPTILEGMDRGRVWIIDPIDGTSNFAAGRRPFGMIIALIEDGVVEAGWLFDPTSGRLCHAVRGGGVFINDERFEGCSPVERTRPIAALATQFMSPQCREELHGRAAKAFDLVPIPRCAAEHYPRLVLGQNDIALFQRTLPWDHAAGVLLLTESGGWVSRWDGSPYRIGDDKIGLTVARTHRLWDRAMTTLVCATSEAIVS